MTERQWPALSCAARGHLVAEGDGLVYNAIGGAEGTSCPGCAPTSPTSASGDEATPADPPSGEPVRRGRLERPNPEM
jgi:hypothetical protein